MLVKKVMTLDAKMTKLLAIADSVACSRATVLIQGESGTGKELIAQYIHEKSNRARHDFVAINCAAVPEGLLESELFGHERGAFTGADSRKIGKFEMANASTLLLDEVSELPLHLQSKLLRVLQENEIDRVGGTKPIKIDVRIIAATNKNIFELVKAERFREDLFYRLNVIPIEVPALRYRGKDIEFLSAQFVESSCRKNNLPAKNLSEAAIDKLKNWTWPGNIRELQNVIERSVLLCANQIIDVNDLQIENYSERGNEYGLRAGMTVQEAERLLIVKTLEHTEQNKTQAAYMLGISIRTLRNKLNEYKLEKIYE